MKTTELAKRLKEISGAGTNEAALERVEALLSERVQETAPVGVLLIISPGNIFPTLFGFNPPIRSADLEMVRGAMLAYVNGYLDRLINEVRRAEVRAEVEKELGVGDGDGD